MQMSINTATLRCTARSVRPNRRIVPGLCGFGGVIVVAVC
jgi:hypothetical protein